ncbi:rod shape-determining protein MreC [Enterobacteriaceae endosymbiont of Donacia versicolorea]|uniref:rod shape-determining protein MreC n=1 Tax=Enterobacteriaceae endosymbiont of Donacia versicolorea TaxID=2675788 RepID=UPI001449BCE3|nr:rod shape-determining protein MreC [Enterobacteriaceae endosymbiont of Donacia versicolorea]QJC31895.1 rod shape-determining protein MreC [Enterobacteriaceae endosymbiont of Donacia versicolorea]
MKLIFDKKPILIIRVIIAMIISFIIITTDLYSNYFVNMRYFIDKKLSPIYIIINKPYYLYITILSYFKKNNLLQKQNRCLSYKILQQNIKLYGLKKIQYENNNLKKFFKLPILKEKKNVLAKIIPIYFPVYKNKIFINKGYKDKIKQGTIVLNEKGIIGRVITVRKKNSQVLLICNKNIFIPVQVKNSNIKFIINGHGCTKRLQSEYISSDIIINKGDILITSGLDEEYPAGYPVGIITKIIFDKEKNLKKAYIKSFIQIEKIKYLLLLIN